MTEKPVRPGKKFFGLSRLAGRKSAIAVFLVLFLLGYNLILSALQQSSSMYPPAGAPNPPDQVSVSTTAPVVASFTCPESSGNSGQPCEVLGQAMIAANILIADLLQNLVADASQLELWVDVGVQAMLQSEYDQIDWLEKSMISWWQTMWYYNLQPSYEQMTRQLDVELALQAQQIQANADASAVNETERALARHAIADQEMHPGEQVCVAATEGGGFTRATAFSRVMRQAWEMKSVAAGLNQQKDPDGNVYPGATSAAGSDQQRYQDWQNIFCDTQSNSLAQVPCGQNPDPNLTNADILPVKYLFNNLTIPVDSTASSPSGHTEGYNMELALEYLINNLVGMPAMDAVTPGALSSPDGEASYLSRRSYLARYAAVRSVPDMVAGWRMPGSTPNGSASSSCGATKGIAAFVCDLRQHADTPLAGLSKNPSYKEIMHALSVDRFDSGRYASQMITDPAKIDLEKLDISVFYLMQLRDYYELLERTALTLAVQVSVLADQQSDQSADMAPLGAPAQPGG